MEGELSIVLKPKLPKTDTNHTCEALCTLLGTKWKDWQPHYFIIEFIEPWRWN